MGSFDIADWPTNTKFYLILLIPTFSTAIFGLATMLSANQGL